jgi:hypothetical protein
MSWFRLVARGGNIFSEYRDDSPLSLIGPGEITRAGRIEPVPGRHAAPVFQVELSTEIAAALQLPSIVFVDETGRAFHKRQAAEEFEARCVNRYLTHLSSGG